MFAAIALAGRLLREKWPALAAWYLVGILGSYVVIETAGFVGAYTALGGLLIMPLAILVRLVSFVAMFLVLREGMPRLEAIAPSPPNGPERRRAFLNALLAGILPFFAFYAAWGMLRKDMSEYTARALEVQQGIILGSIVNDQEVSLGGTIDRLVFEPVTIALIVIAFTGRWVWQKYRSKLPKVLAVAAVYLEALWVFLTVTLIAEMLGWVTGWVQSRVAFHWLADARSWVDGQLEPVAWLWDGLEWLLGEAGGLILLPVAWLTIAGVLYGQAVAARSPKISLGRLSPLSARFGKLPQRLRARFSDFWNQFIGRFRPIGRAIVLMWRAGPVLIASYVLLYTVVLAIEGGLELLLTRLIGPQDFNSFWAVFDVVLFMPIALIIEPLRIALVSATYDHVLGRLSLQAAQESVTDAPAESEVEATAEPAFELSVAECESEKAR